MRADEHLQILAPDDVLIRGTRIPLACLIDAWREGFTPEDIVREYPSVTLPQAYALIAHYLANREEVDAYMIRSKTSSDLLHRHLAEAVPPAIERLRRVKATRAGEDSKRE